MNKYGPIKHNYFSQAHWVKLYNGKIRIHLGEYNFVVNGEELQFINNPNFFPKHEFCMCSYELIKNPPMKPFTKPDQVIPLMEHCIQIFYDLKGSPRTIEFIGNNHVMLDGYQSFVTFQELFEKCKFADGRPVGMDGEE